MAEQTGARAVDVLGFVYDFWKRLVAAVEEAGGSKDHLDRLNKQNVQGILRRYAYELVARLDNVFLLSSNFTTFQAAIEAGDYARLQGYAGRPDLITSIHPHPVVGTYRLVPCLGNDTASLVQGTSQAGLNALLDFGRKHPDISGVVVAWEDDFGEITGHFYWHACLTTQTDGSRSLSIDRSKNGSEVWSTYSCLQRIV